MSHGRALAKLYENDVEIVWRSYGDRRKELVAETATAARRMPYGN
jgi:hypothetical protein